MPCTLAGTEVVIALVMFMGVVELWNAGTEHGW